MAAASQDISLQTIADLVRKTCACFRWNKRDSTHKTFLKHLKGFAEEVALTLEDLSKHSIRLTKEIIYSSNPQDNKYNETDRFQNIPYIIYVGEDNITNVVIRKGHADCPIKEITPDMMHALQYLGVVRIYIGGQLTVRQLTVPCWTDNIIHLEFPPINYIYGMQYIDEHRIPFPKYLQYLIDNTGIEGQYTNWLPNNITTLKSACLELQNLSPSLKYYHYTGFCTQKALSMVEYLPIGVKKARYPCITPYQNYSCEPITMSEISMPHGTEELEISLRRICSHSLAFRNIQKLFICFFKVLIITSREQIEGYNLTIEKHWFDTEPYWIYKQNVEVILEEGLLHLTLKLIDSTEFLLCIKHVPVSLEKLTILAYDDVHTYLLNSNNFSMEYNYTNESQIHIHQTYIRNFLQRFPNITLIIENA